ncbi:MAG: hypothetical protein KJO79_06795 [Verrucomicrobiae bacterium]|nr:hypothetical protein [Verrucomicrobiae bacterium]NNJ86868.1 hypothetical protein [Akkermansiaceae bacterium]
MKQTSFEKTILRMSAALVLVLLAGAFLTTIHAEASDDTIVYWGGGKRCHVKGCKRLTKDPALLAKMTKMTYGGAKKKGILLCSRCPGSSTPGKANPAGGKKKVGKDYGKYGRKGAKARKAWLKIPEKKYDSNTKVYCDALWMRVHEENCPMLVLKQKKKVITLGQADKEGWRIGESGQSGRQRCCFKGYRRNYPEKDISGDAMGIVQKLKNGKLKWHLAGCHRFTVKRDQTPMTLKEAKQARAYMCPHCVERGPSLTTADLETLKMRPTAPVFTPPEDWTPVPFSPHELPSKKEMNMLIKETLAQGSGIQEAVYKDPVATMEEFMGRRFFFPVGQWLAFYLGYRATGDKRILESLRVSARHYRDLCGKYPSVARQKAKNPEHMTFMYSMAVSARLTLQLARKHPDQVSQKEIAEAEGFLKAMVATLKPVCEGNDNLDPKMGIPKKLADDFRSRAFNRAANGIGTYAMASAALKDLQAIRNTTEYQPQIDLYQKCVQQWVKNWKSVGCLYTEADGKKYFYYPYGASEKPKIQDGLKFYGADDQGHFGHCMQGAMLMYDATPELGVDDDFMTAIANAIYHNSYTKNGSIQCPSADRIRPLSRHPFALPIDRFYMFEAFRDGIIDGQCSKLSKRKKAEKNSGYSARLKTLHAQYLKALRKDRTLVYLGETK